MPSDKLVRTFSWGKGLLAGVIAVLALATYILLPADCPEAARRCAAILVVAAGFWALEIFPVYATSMIVVLLLCFGLAKPDGVLDMDPKGYTAFLVPFASPVVILFFGGLVLASALRKHGADKYIASQWLQYFLDSPSQLLWGAMLITAGLSMWISNTAATAIMLGLYGPLLTNERIDITVKKALVLSLAFSANIGGIATPIGTPPNALALGFLGDFNASVSFLTWVLLCLPLTLLLLGVCWAILRLSLTDLKENWHSISFTKTDLNPKASQVLYILAGTIALWLTAPFHGIPEPLTALLSSGVLMAWGLIDREDLKRIDWDVLILMWGGLALGVGVELSGLGHWLVSKLIEETAGITLAFSFAALAMLLSLFISNTAAAALILPLALEAAGPDKTMVGIVVALSCSVAMVFPISTPPNALAYGSGYISNAEMFRWGAVLTAFCFGLIMLGFWWIIPWIAL